MALKLLAVIWGSCSDLALQAAALCIEEWLMGAGTPRTG